MKHLHKLILYAILLVHTSYNIAMDSSRLDIQKILLRMDKQDQTIATLQKEVEENEVFKQEILGKYYRQSLALSRMVDEINSLKKPATRSSNKSENQLNDTAKNIDDFVEELDKVKAVAAQQAVKCKALGCQVSQQALGLSLMQKKVDYCENFQETAKKAFAGTVQSIKKFTAEINRMDAIIKKHSDKLEDHDNAIEYHGNNLEDLAVNQAIMNNDLKLSSDEQVSEFGDIPFSFDPNNDVLLHVDEFSSLSSLSNVSSSLSSSQGDDFVIFTSNNKRLRNEKFNNTSNKK